MFHYSKLYNRSNTAVTDTLKHLIDKASDEIETYRRRQITMFREAVIVMAFIIWGTFSILEKKIQLGWLIKSATAIACIGTGFIGMLIIFAYKRRIYHVRGKRDDLCNLIQTKAMVVPPVESIFYPTGNKKDDPSTEEKNKSKGSDTSCWDRIKDKFMSVATSTYYGWVLMGLCIIAAIVIIVLTIDYPNQAVGTANIK